VRWKCSLALAVAMVAAPGAAAALPRATTDRPDDFPGLQVHMVYAVAADAADRGFDTDGSIQAAVDSFQQWLAGQAGGRALRVDTFQGSVDVTFHRVAALDGQEGTVPLYAVSADLAQAGLLQAGKVYGVYYDGGSGATACGNASWPLWPQPADATVATVYLHSQGGTCFHGFPAAGEPPNYTVFAMLHDVVHTLGIVGPCARNYTPTLPGHVGDSNADLMYAGPLPWQPATLDVGRDDYFGASIPGCVDLGTVGFLTTPTSAALDVTVSGNGRVVSSPWPLLDCTATCSASYGTGTVVGLVARPGAGSELVAWSGACSGNDACLVTLDDARSVTATFEPIPRTLTVSLIGTGAGEVTSEPAGLRCRSACTVSFASGTAVTLHALTAPGSRFEGWGRPGCDGAECRLTLDADEVVDAEVDDVQPPRTHALASHGARGGFAQLRYRVSDNMGEAAVAARVYGALRLRHAAASGGIRRVFATHVYSLRWRVPRSLRTKRLRFCVHAVDAAGLVGKRSCARLTLR
jgi:hypothetical protein